MILTSYESEGKKERREERRKEKVANETSRRKGEKCREIRLVGRVARTHARIVFRVQLVVLARSHCASSSSVSPLSLLER